MGETVLRWDGAKAATEMTDEGGDVTKVHGPHAAAQILHMSLPLRPLTAPTCRAPHRSCRPHNRPPPQARQQLDRFLDFRGNTLFATLTGARGCCWQPSWVCRIRLLCTGHRPAGRCRHLLHGLPQAAHGADALPCSHVAARCAACCVGCATWQRNFNLIPRLSLRCAWGGGDPPFGGCAAAVHTTLHTCIGHTTFCPPPCGPAASSWPPSSLPLCPGASHPSSTETTQGPAASAAAGVRAGARACAALQKWGACCPGPCHASRRAFMTP